MYLVTLNTGKLLFPTHVEAIIAYSILGEFRKHDEIYALRAVRDIIFEQHNGLWEHTIQQHGAFAVPNLTTAFQTELMDLDILCARRERPLHEWQSDLDAIHYWFWLNPWTCEMNTFKPISCVPLEVPANRLALHLMNIFGFGQEIDIALQLLTRQDIADVSRILRQLQATYPNFDFIGLFDNLSQQYSFVLHLPLSVVRPKRDYSCTR